MFTAPSDLGTVDSITIGGQAVNSGSSGRGFITGTDLIIIENSVSNKLTPFLGLPGSFLTDNYSIKPSLVPGNQYILFMAIGAMTRSKYDSGSTNQGYLDQSNSAETPTNPTDATLNNNKYSIYITYSPPPLMNFNGVTLQGLNVN